jgi:site-specific DNA recombinase
MIRMAIVASIATLRAAIYTRVSTSGQADAENDPRDRDNLDSGGSSLKTQEQANRQHIAQHGYTLDDQHIYREVFTGTELWNRPQLNRLREAVRARAVDVVIVFAIDRLSRDPVHLGVILSEAEHYGVDYQFVSEPLDHSPEGELIRFVRGYAAKVEHVKIVERTVRGKRAKAASGQDVGIGIAPYGYRYLVNAKGKQNALAVNPRAAPIVERIFAEAATLSGKKIAKRLTEDGIPAPLQPGRSTPNPAGWSATTIRDMIHNPAYTGRRPYGRRAGKAHTPQDHSTWIYSDVPAIVTREAQDLAQLALAERRQRVRAARRSNRVRLSPTWSPHVRTLRRAAPVSERRGYDAIPVLLLSSPSSRMGGSPRERTVLPPTGPR